MIGTYELCEQFTHLKWSEKQPTFSTHKKPYAACLGQNGSLLDCLTHYFSDLHIKHVKIQKRCDTPAVTLITQLFNNQHMPCWLRTTEIFAGDHHIIDTAVWVPWKKKSELHAVEKLGHDAFGKWLFSQPSRVLTKRLYAQQSNTLLQISKWQLQGHDAQKNVCVLECLF